MVIGSHGRRLVNTPQLPVSSLQLLVASTKSGPKAGATINRDEEVDMPGKGYPSLIAWKKAFELALAIYEDTTS